MKKNLSEKILYAITILLITLTILLCSNYPTKTNIYLFLLVFGVIYWQRKRLQDFFQKIKNPKVCIVLYILTGWIWMIFFELQLDKLPFHPKPLADLIIGLGFYVPYFALWLKFIKRYQFDFLEIFYLSGLGKIIFDLVITRKLLIAASVATNLFSASLIFFSQAIVTLALFGMLTILPALYLTNQTSQRHNKPLREYLAGLTPVFFAAGVFIIWTMILKIIFKT